VKPILSIYSIYDESKISNPVCVEAGELDIKDIIKFCRKDTKIITSFEAKLCMMKTNLGLNQIVLF
jgi:hypothetical protein